MLAAVRQSSRPCVTVEANGTPLPDPVAASLIRAVVDHTLGLPESFVLSFHEPAQDAERQVPALFPIGATVKVVLGTEEDPGTKLTLTAEVTALEAEFDYERGTRTTVRGAGKCHRLLRGRKTKAFIEKTYSDIASEIAGGASLTTSAVTSTTEVHPMVIQAGRSDWEFLADLAAEIGFVLTADGDKLGFGPPPAPSAAPARKGFDATDPLELVWGDNLLRLAAAVKSDAQVTEVVARGWDPKTKQALIGRAQAASALVTVDVGGHAPADLANLCGGAGFQAPGLGCLSQAGADKTAKALADRLAGAAYEVEGVARGSPALVAGKAVRLSCVGDPFEGKYALTSTRHVVEAGRPYVTHFQSAGLGDRTLLGLASGGRSQSPPGGTAVVQGVVPALVTNVKDPDNLGRAKVKFPWLDDVIETDWVRIASPTAGAGRGFFTLPEIDDEVLVAFDHGDLQRPYILGGMWNGKDKPPKATTAVDANSGAVITRALTSRKGHFVAISDKDGEESVEIGTTDARLRIKLDKDGKALILNCSDKIEIDADGDITITSAKKVCIKATGDLELAGQNIKVTAQANLDLKANGNMTAKGTQATFEGSATTAVKGATLQLQGSAIAELKAPLVKIN